MDDLRSSPRPTRGPRLPERPLARVNPGFAVPLLFVLGLALAWPSIARPADPPVFDARGGLALAEDAARSWAPDAYLTYVENDDDLDVQGAAIRWGYLFYSPSRDQSRAYSVRDGRILVAENLDMKFEAPALAPDWIDSDRALAAAEASVGQSFRTKYQGRLTTMLLMRGAFQEGDPDETTWTIVYTSPGAPALFVMVDASGAKVRRTWRG